MNNLDQINKILKKERKRKEPYAQNDMMNIRKIIDQKRYTLKGPQKYGHCEEIIPILHQALQNFTDQNIRHAVEVSIHETGYADCLGWTMRIMLNKIISMHNIYNIIVDTTSYGREENTITIKIAHAN